MNSLAIMDIMRGIEDNARDNEMLGGFFTLTAPSQYHAYIIGKDGCAVKNKHYQGFSPKQTQQYLLSTWVKALAKLKRLDIQFSGVRICEPHNDGTPHFHAMLFFKPADEQNLRAVFADYFTHDDVVSSINRGFDCKMIDPDKGSATGYIAKYTAKNIASSAEAISSWASLWGIRQFQKIGGMTASVRRALLTVE